MPGVAIWLCYALYPFFHHLYNAQLLVNNAGIYSPAGRRPKLDEFTAADFAPVFATNSVGPFLVVQQLLARQLLGPPGSVVVNVSSILASNRDPTVSAVTPGAYAYRCAAGGGGGMGALGWGGGATTSWGEGTEPGRRAAAGRRDRVGASERRRPDV